jgi:hypothetical protein
LCNHNTTFNSHETFPFEQTTKGNPNPPHLLSSSFQSKLQQKVEQVSAQLRIWIPIVTDLPLLGKESGCNPSGAGIEIAITGKCK